MPYQDVRHLAICKHKGIPITPESVILDFGCGEGHRVYQLHALGFPQSYGFNKGHYMGGENPIQLRQESDRQWFRFSDDGLMPFPDNTFDLIISDQVFEHVVEQEQAFCEIHRVLKPGGVSIHVMPAKWKFIEPHIKVPLGGFEPFKRYAYYYLWACLGVRSPHQHGQSAHATAQSNLTYATGSLKYLSCRQYRRLLRRLHFHVSWEELAYMQTSFRPRIQQVATVAATVPLLLSLIRTFIERVLFLRKDG